MKVVKVKDSRSRKRLERKALMGRKVVAVISDIRDMNDEVVKKADVVIVDESFGKELLLSKN